MVPFGHPISKNSYLEIFKLKNEDDPTKKIFGVYPGIWPYNLVEKVSNSGKPPQEDVITIKYVKHVDGPDSLGEVTFKCSTFEYKQDRVPADDYAIWFLLRFPPHELEIKLTETK